MIEYDLSELLMLEIMFVGRVNSLKEVLKLSPDYSIALTFGAIDVLRRGSIDSF